MSGNKTVRYVELVDTGLGYRIFLCIQFRDWENQLAIYTIKEHDLKNEYRADLLKGERVEFKRIPHNHWVWNFDISAEIPIYEGNIEERKTLRSPLQRWMDAIRSKRGIYEALLYEIEKTQRETYEYSYEIWQKALAWKKKIDELENNFDLEGIGAKELLIPTDAVRLKIELGRVFDLLKQLRIEKEEQRSQNFDVVKGELSECRELAEETEDWSYARHRFNELRERIKNTDLARERREELWKAFNKAFDTLNTRQDIARKEYEKECKANYGRFYNELVSLKREASKEDDSRIVRSQLKETQGEMKESSLNKEQRDELWKMIQEVYGILNAQQEAYNRECDRNYNSFKINADLLRRRAQPYQDTRSLRQELKDLQTEIKQSKLKRDQRQELWDTINGIFTLLSNHDRRYLEEKIEKLSGVVAGLEESIRKSKNFLDQKYEALSNVHEGKRASEIRSSIMAQIREVEGQINSKEEKLSDMRSSLRQLESKLANY